MPALSVTLTVCEVVDMRTNARIRLPAVLTLGNTDRTKPTPEPIAFADCTSAIPPPPLGPIVILSAAVAVWLAASCTFAVKLLVPTLVGVPVIAPVLALRFKPAGRVPEIIDHVYGAVPPAAVRVAL